MKKQTNKEQKSTKSNKLKIDDLKLELEKRVLEENDSFNDEYWNEIEKEVDSCVDFKYNNRYSYQNKKRVFK